MRCQLCTLNCDNCKMLFDEHANATEFCRVVVQYFDLQSLQTESVENLSKCSICIVCWQHIRNFHNFQQTIEQLQALYEQLLPALESKMQNNTTEQMETTGNANDIDAYMTEDLFTSDASTKDDELWQKHILNRRKKRETPKDKHDEFITKVLGDALPCEICNENCANFSELRKHFFHSHNLSPYIYCCKIKFIGRKRLADHLQTHLNPDIYKCSICNKCCLTKRKLATHRRYHKGHKCKYCEQVLLSVQSLREHIDSHIKTSQGYKCLQCNKIFRIKRSLRQHEYLRHERYVEPLVCDQCGAKLGTPATLQKHKRTIHNDSEDFKKSCSCNLCGRVLSNPWSLHTHKRNIHKVGKDKRVKCEICSKMVKNPWVLKIHHRNVHSSTKPEKKGRKRVVRCKETPYTSKELTELFLQKHEN